MSDKSIQKVIYAVVKDSNILISSLMSAGFKPSHYDQIDISASENMRVWRKNNKCSIEYVIGTKRYFVEIDWNAFISFAKNHEMGLQYTCFNIVNTHGHWEIGFIPGNNRQQEEDGTFSMPDDVIVFKYHGYPYSDVEDRSSYNTKGLLSDIGISECDIEFKQCEHGDMLFVVSDTDPQHTSTINNYLYTITGIDNLVGLTQFLIPKQSPVKISRQTVDIPSYDLLA